ncbi:hypothetical protein [Fulvivirga sp.]|uniref:lactate/malate family dehydrogenase n=1 Tax=Fulvivirga sp. TaxID=1931237 RepID=UPI0032F046FC
MRQNLTITIIGLGEVGGTIASLILGETSNSTINLVDIKDVSGRVLDIKHAGTFTNNKVIANNPFVTNHSDFIIYTAGFSNAVNAERNSVADQNKVLVRKVFRKIQPKKDAVIIAVSNPVELVSQWISEIYKNNITVVGTGTFLDTVRLKFLISERLNKNISLVDTIVIGEHGENMTPVYSQTTVDSESIFDILGMKQIEELTTNLKNSARSIRSTESATKFGVAQCVVEIIKAFYSNQTIVPLSIMINDAYKKLLGAYSDNYISLPCKIVEFTPIPVMLDLDPQEFINLKNAYNSISRYK